MSDPMSLEDEHPPAPRDRKRDARLVATGVVAVLLVWFALINLQDVRIHFWVTSTKAPLILVIVVAGVLGAAVGGLVSLMSRRRHQPD
jgi:uncharacterized integral membrane protein